MADIIKTIDGADPAQQNQTIIGDDSSQQIKLTSSGGAGTFQGWDVRGAGGNDSINLIGSPVNTDVFGDGGEDTLTAGGFPGATINGSRLFGGDGNDLLEYEGVGGANNDFGGGKGSDEFKLSGDFSTSSLFGGPDDGQDQVLFMADSSFIDSKAWLGDGDDTLDDQDFAVNFSGSRIGTKGGDDFVDINNSNAGPGGLEVFLGDGDDTLQGPLTGDVLAYGGAGNDSIETEEGNDTVFGGSGNDTIDLGDNDDTAFGESGNDTILGRDGNDTIFGGNGADLLSGGDGTDSILGNAGNDKIFGGDEDDTLDGGLNDDTIDGGFGDDLIFGGDGTGRDYLVGDVGDDTISGGSGNDTIFGGLNRVASGGESSEVSNFLGFFPTKYGNDPDGTGTDAGPNDADDSLLGNSGADLIFGDAGDDTLGGGFQDDTLVGNSGSDLLTGDGGADLFVQEDDSSEDVEESSRGDNITVEFGTDDAPDIITDFSAVEGDVIAFEGESSNVDEENFEDLTGSATGSWEFGDIVIFAGQWNEGSNRFNTFSNVASEATDLLIFKAEGSSTTLEDSDFGDQSVIALGAAQTPFTEANFDMFS